MVGEYNLASAGAHNHANSLCFGNEIPVGNNRPVTYVTECASRTKCFVGSLTDSSAILMQTIQATLNGKELRVNLWAVDVSRYYLYALTRNDKYALDNKGSKKHYIQV